MSEEKVDKHIQYMQSLVSDLDDYIARSGENVTIRNKMSSNISHAVLMFGNYLGKNKDLSDALLSYHGGNHFGFDETLSFKYLVRDIPRFINYLKELT